MEINKKNRTELKAYFLANKIPTQKDFEEFINANLNQAEDGIAKVQGSPIALEAEGDSGGTQEVLNLFSSFADANPSWSINLNPRVDPVVPASNKPGLNFKDAGGASQLFIKSVGGDVGLGTIEPTSRLSIQARDGASLISVVSETTGSANIFEVSQEDNNGVLSIRSGNGTLVSKLSGDSNKPGFFMSKLGVGTDDPKSNLHISGQAAELRISNTTSGLSPRLTLQNDAGSDWEITTSEHNGSWLHIHPVGEVGKGMDIRKDGKVRALGGLNFGERATHLDEDGSMYRLGGKLYLSIDDEFFIRDIGGVEKFGFHTDNGRMAIGGKFASAPMSIKGTGKDDKPDEAMHITSGSILFGGNNAGKQMNSGKITAGTHVANSLNIVGMSSSASTSSDRKVDIWAEGGMTVRGHVKSPGTYVVAFSVSLSTNQTGVKNPLNFGQVNYNIGNHFTSNKYFIAPVTGMYMFAMCMRNNTSNDVGWRLRLNDSGYVNGASGSSKNERTMLVARLDLHMNSRTVITKLNAGDKVHVEQFGSGGNDNYASGFDGMLLQAME
jgi:hypothetical protein